MNKGVMDRVGGGGGEVVAAGVAVAALLVGFLVLRHHLARRKKEERRKRWGRVEKDVVVVHGLNQSYVIPNMSPFVLTLQTYLRMANIPYQMDYEEPFGPKGQSPWISFNGEEIGDSQLIIEHLARYFGKDFSSQLTDQQKGVARAITMMVTEHLAWGFRRWRWIEDEGRGAFKSMGGAPLLGRLTMPLFKRRIMGLLWVQGLGRHTKDEVISIVRRDLEAISLYLEDKAYTLGDELHEVDCAVFGALAQVWWTYLDSPYRIMLEDDFPNLKAYVLRVKERLWPDWDQCLKQL